MEKILKIDQTDIGRRGRQFLGVYLTNRKLVALTLFLLVVFIYFWPKRRLWSSPVVSGLEASYFCLNNELRQWAKQETSFDVIVQHSPERKQWEKPFIPFVGNGHLGLGVGDGDERVRVGGRRALSLPLNLRPLLSLSLKGFSSSDAILTDYKRGAVTKIQSYSVDSECVTISTTIFAHRMRPKVLVQDFTVKNPLVKSLEVVLKRSANNWSKRRQEKVGDRVVDVVSTRVTVPGSALGVAVAVAIPTLPLGPISIKPKGAQEFRYLTIIDASESNQADPNASKLQEDRVLKLWETGFDISFSRAPDILNGDRINATRYAVLSNVPAPLHEIDTALQSQHAQHLKETELCFNSHNTLLYPSKKLWSDLRTVDELVEVANKWRLTLEKRGCVNLLKAGADGMAQAMVLSFGPLKYTHHHIEYDVHPKELHRDYHFHGLLFGGVNSTKVNIWVEVGEDNKAVLFASVYNAVNPNQSLVKTFYACDAGCLDPPVKLSSERTQFPVKLTEPLTPILYVTPDREHLEEMKHSIHVQEVNEAPANEHHVIAMHKHGHRLGGLPTMFWVCLTVLIVTFHLFLFKLIFNEYCRDDKTLSRGRYSV